MLDLLAVKCIELVMDQIYERFRANTHGPDTTKMVSALCFKDSHLKPMTHAMRRR